ncbi:hypothetical protein Ancab_010353 [Ancistrocladus abbreviatus]
MSMRSRSSSPFSYRRASSPFSSSSSTSSFMNTSGRFVPRSCSTFGSSFYGSANGYGARSTTLNRNQSDSMYAATRGYGGRSLVGFPTSEELSREPLDVPRLSRDSISVTVRFRPMNEAIRLRDKIVRSEYNPATAYAFDKVFGPNATSEEVYEVAAQPVVKAAMEGVNGTVFAYGVTSSGKTHTMHTPGREFLLHVSYLEICNELLKRYPGMVPDVDMMFDCMDKPAINQTEHSARPLPLFCYCTTTKHFDVPFPNWSFWGWPEVNLGPWGEEFREIRRGSQSRSWTNKWPYTYWKGNPYVASPLRTELLWCDDTRQWRTQIFRQDWNEEARVGYKQSKLSSQCNHRYKIYAEGYAWSVSLKYIVACGSLTLLITPQYEDFFTRGLIPKKNYWPVPRADLCRSIKNAVDWGNTYPSEAEAVGREGQHFMDSLSMGRVYDYMYHLITEYSKLLDFKHGMIESNVHSDEYDGVIFSQLNLIDLAGSDSSKTETTGLRRKEGSYINKSLLTLGTLICTVIPASSSTEETHNTLKFASRSKRVEIYASRNKIVDEKSLIKKYQREISSLKQELDQLRRGMLAGISHEEIMSLRQQLEEGQVKMQSRLEEEEAKAALMSRIQRLTKLILVSTKNDIPGYLGEVSGHQ